ncbi:MAG: hypothetical protein RL701_4808 [Pseudomonadota bacterium]|jgi:hypothetical protein
MTTSVLIVERPGQFRDSLLHEVNQRGASGFVRDDAMEALASIERLAPQIVVVSDDPGPPGALGLCRMLRRKLVDVAVYRIGEPSTADQLDERSLLLPRAVGPSALASAILDRSLIESGALASHRAWEGTVASLELGPLLLAIETRWLTGRLIITRPGTERELSFVRGKPIYARSSVLAERLGVLGVRRGILTEAQVEQALELAHARDVRIGTALLEIGALDATRLLRLLSAQLLEQLTAASNAGACHARFVIDQTVATRHPILRVSSLTALLHASAATPLEDVEQVLDELAEHALVPELPRPAEQWLSDLQLPDASKLGSDVSSVRALRARMREVAVVQPGEAPLHPDVLTLALLRSGAFRMPIDRASVPQDTRSGLRSMSPPSIVSAVVRCSQSDFSRWPVSALGRARTTLEQAIDECLHGTRPAEQARALALLGPEADCDPRFAEVYALTLTTNPAQPLVSNADNARQPTLSELRLRCHALLKRLDTLEAEYSGVRARVHLLQTRAHAERTLAALPSPEAQMRAPSARELNPPSAPANDVPIATAQPVTLLLRGESPSVGPEKRASDAPKVSDAALLSAAEPLVQQARWHELQLLLVAKSDNPALLAPVFALLYAISLKEDPAVVGDDKQRPAAHAETVGISVVSKLLGIPKESPAAVLIAKRLLRSRPVEVHSKPASSTSMWIASGVALVGAAVGFLLHSPLLGLFGK